MSSFAAQKRAMLPILRSIFPDAAVTYSRPVRLETQMAWLGDARFTSGQPTSNGNGRRPRREDVELDVILSYYRAGNPDDTDDAQAEAEAGAADMLTELDTYFRTVANPVLLPGCSPSIVSSGDSTINPVTDRADVIVGWSCDITATISTTATV